MGKLYERVFLELGIKEELEKRRDQEGFPSLSALVLHLLEADKGRKQPGKKLTNPAP